MKNWGKWGGALAAVTMVLAAPAQAQSTLNPATLNQAEQIRRLDIMLMVTSLRCRTGANDFQADYRRFSAAHLTELNASARQLQASLVKRHGAKGASRALDRISVGMANQYGQGHPWLECADLRSVTRELASSRDPQALASAAGELLSDRPVGRIAVARR